MPTNINPNYPLGELEARQDELDKQIEESGMIPIRDLMKCGNLGGYMAHTGVRDYDSFEK